MTNHVSGRIDAEIEKTVKCSETFEQHFISTNKHTYVWLAGWSSGSLLLLLCHRNEIAPCCDPDPWSTRSQRARDQQRNATTSTFRARFGSNKGSYLLIPATHAVFRSVTLRISADLLSLLCWWCPALCMFIYETQINRRPGRCLWLPTPNRLVDRWSRGSHRDSSNLPT